MRLFGELEFLIDDNMNQSNTRLLSAMVETDSISHAYLFSGNNTDQLYKLALSFAASINCTEGGCGNCEVCRGIIKGVNSNILVVESEGNILRIEEIAALQRFMSMSAYGPGRKICIIRESELMNREAANRLLKTLEDPPDERSVFILLSEDMSVMLPTIISRCLVYSWNFEFEDGRSKQTEFKILEKYLDEGLKSILVDKKINHDTLDLSLKVLEILRKMEAGIRSSLEMELERIDNRDYEKNDLKKYQSILKSKHKRKLAKFKKLGISRVFDIISAWLEDIITVRLGASQENLNFKNNYSFINNKIRNVKIKEIIKLLEAIEGNRAYLGYSINPELALDNIFLNVDGLILER